MDNTVSEAISALKGGRKIMIRDFASRENETDLMMAAEHVDPEAVSTLRTDGGGLLCLALSTEFAKQIGTPYFNDLLKAAKNEYPTMTKLSDFESPYGGRPAFSITINHRDTYTGITDWDRATTISEFSKFYRDVDAGGFDPKEEFVSRFRCPGHVHLLIASGGLLSERVGHTEMSVYLTQAAGLAPLATICEMLDEKTHRALTIENSISYAKRNSIPILMGDQIIEHYNEKRGK
ncbi:MAG: 3,4-dihydroxy-2-butanone-4-phosphate synthase [Nitrososphaerales archaeon]